MNGEVSAPAEPELIAYEVKTITTRQQWQDKMPSDYELSNLLDRLHTTVKSEAHVEVGEATYVVTIHAEVPAIHSDSGITDLLPEGVKAVTVQRG